MIKLLPLLIARKVHEDDFVDFIQTITDLGLEAATTSSISLNSLSISIQVIKPHRSNILSKSGESSISDVIRDLKEKGLL